MEFTDIKCPECKRVMKVKFNEMVPGRKKKCAACGAETIFAGDDLRNVQKSLDELRKQFSKISLSKR